MSNIAVAKAHGGVVTEFSITHEITGTLPEMGIKLLFQRYAKEILHAARRKFSCFKVYIVCVGVFQVTL